MKDILILFVFGVLVTCFIYLGFVKTIKESFKAGPTVNGVDSAKMRREQRRRMEDINQQQRRMMDDMQQRIRDAGRNRY